MKKKNRKIDQLPYLLFEPDEYILFVLTRLDRDYIYL